VNPADPLTSKTRRALFASFREYLGMSGKKDTARRIAWARTCVPSLRSFTELTEGQGQMLLEKIEAWGPWGPENV